MFNIHYMYGEATEEIYNIEYIQSTLLSVGEIEEVSSVIKTVDSFLSGNTILLLDGSKEALVIDLHGWKTRSIVEPLTESSVRGPHEGFTETLRINTSLLRRKIKNANLMFESMKLGVQTRTDICIAYINGITNPKLAKKGLIKYLDFFMRDPETRMNVLLLISQNKAAEILKQQSEVEKVPANNIAKLIRGYSSATSQTRAVILTDLIPQLMSKTIAPTIPFIKLSKNGNKKIATISGTAVFKHEKLIGMLNKSEGRGLIWTMGNVKSGILEVPDFSNNKVSLEIIRAGSKMVPKLNNNKITIKISINEEGNIGEQTGPENLVDLKAIASLEKSASEAIKNEVMASVKKAKKLDTEHDFDNQLCIFYYQL